MICTLKKSMRQELEEFDLLTMNRADYRHSWTYSFGPLCFCMGKIIVKQLATVSENFNINLEGQNYVHFYVILSRNVKIFGIMASL